MCLYCSRSGLIPGGADSSEGQQLKMLHSLAAASAALQLVILTAAEQAPKQVVRVCV